LAAFEEFEGSVAQFSDFDEGWVDGAVAVVGHDAFDVVAELLDGVVRRCFGRRTERTVLTRLRPW
jgi:hypothetical protein